MASKIKEAAIMRLAGVRELISHLLWRDRAISIGEAGITSLDEQNLQNSITLLLKEKWLKGEDQHLPLLEQKFRLTGNRALLSLITQAMLDFEKEFIEERAEGATLQAAEKLRAIDSLADAIFIARKNVREDADIF
jgi:hypothetical protein